MILYFSLYIHFPYTTAATFYSQYRGYRYTPSGESFEIKIFRLLKNLNEELRKYMFHVNTSTDAFT